MPSATDYLDAPEDEAAVLPAPSDLSGLRAGYLQELSNPMIAHRLYSLTEREVGTQGPRAQQAFIESVFNRAAARKQTLAQAVLDRGYYPEVSLKPARLPLERIGHYNELMANVALGSNLANFATGNASGTVGFAGGPQTFKAGGERFGIEGPDKGWARSLEEVRKGKPVEEVIEPVQIEKAIPIKVRQVEVRRAKPVSAGEFLDQEQPAAAPAATPTPAPAMAQSAEAFLDTPEPEELTPEQQAARAYAQTPEARAELAAPEGSLTAELLKRRRALSPTEVPAAGARGPTAEEQLTQGIAQATQVTPVPGVEVPRRGPAMTVPEAYEEAGGGMGGIINALDFATKQPILSEEQGKQITHLIGSAARQEARFFIGKEPESEETWSAVEDELGKQLSDFSSPQALALIPLLKNPVARVALGGATLSQVPADLQRIADARASGDKKELARAVTQASMNVIMGGALAGEPVLRRAAPERLTRIGAEVVETRRVPEAAGPALAAPEAAAAAEAPAWEALPPAERPRLPGPAAPAVEVPGAPAAGLEGLTRSEAQRIASLQDQLQRGEITQEQYAAEARAVLAPQPAAPVAAAPPPVEPAPEITRLTSEITERQEKIRRERDPQRLAALRQEVGNLEGQLAVARGEAPAAPVMDPQVLRAAALSRAATARQEIENPESGYHPDPETALAQVDQNLKNELAQIDAQVAGIAAPAPGDLWYQGVGPEGQTTWVTSNLEKAKTYAKRRGEGGQINVYTPDQIGGAAFADQEGNPLSPQEYVRTQSEDTTIQRLGPHRPLPEPIQVLTPEGEPVSPAARRPTPEEVAAEVEHRAEMEPAMSADEFLDAPETVAPFRPRAERPLTKRELAEREHQAEMLRQGQEAIRAQGGMDLLEAVQTEGGLPLKGHRFEEGYRGELQRVRDTIRGTKGVRYRDVFRGGAQKVDQLVLRLRARGFDIETPFQLLELLENRIRTGTPHYAVPETAEALYGTERATRVAEAPAPLSQTELATLGKLRRAGTTLTKSGRRKLAQLEARVQPELLAPAEMPFSLRGEELTEEVGAEGAARARAEAEAKARGEQMRLFEVPPGAVGTYVDKQGVPAESKAQATNEIAETLRITEQEQMQFAYEEAKSAPGAIPRGQPEAGRLSAAVFQALQKGGPAASAALKRAGNRASIVLHALVGGNIQAWNLAGTRIISPADVAASVQTIRSPWQESLKAIVTDREGNVLGNDILTIGTVNESLAHPRELFRMLSQLKEKHKGAVRLILTHNHPSGNPEPSGIKGDTGLHKLAKDLAKQAGLELYDHVITNGKRYYSFEHGGYGELPERVSQPWEIIPQEEAPKFERPTGPALYRELIASLRGDDPNGSIILYLGTRNNVLAVERVTKKSLPEIRKAIFNGLAREGAYAFTIDTPRPDPMISPQHWVDTFEKMALNFQAKLLDVSWPGVDSAVVGGLLPEQYAPPAPSVTAPGAAPPAAPPSARVREEPEPGGRPRRFAERFQADKRIAQEIRDRTGNRTYQPISNEITAEQARELVNARPITDIMNAIRDETTGLAFHIRSTMGQQVILRLNQAYQNLKAAGETKDAELLLNQAIEMAEWQQDYGTRLGQGVQTFAMWQKLTPEGKLIGVQRQVRKARNRHKADYTADVEQIKTALSGEKSDADKLAALKKLFKTNQTARRVRPYWQKLIEAAKSGHFTDQTFYDITAERLGLPKYDKATAAEILRLALKIDKAPEGLPKDQATLEFQHFVTTKMGFKPSDLPIGIYYGNMLSGYNTQLVNALDTFVNVLSELNGLVLASPRAADYIYGNTLKGFVEGRADFMLALTKGRQLQDTKWLDVPRLMEVARFGIKGGVPILAEGRAGRAMKRLAESKLGYPLNAWKYVTRLMIASDSIMFRMAKEGRAALLAYRLAKEEGLRGRALDRRVQELLGRTVDQLASLRKQAEQEGFTGLAKVARVTELRERLRNVQANADATEFAGIATYNHEPQGLLGHLSKKIESMFRSEAPGLRTLLPVMRAVIVPFTRIVANVTNRGLNYTPWGFRRAFSGYLKNGPDGGATPIGDQQASMIARAIMGSVGLMTLMLMQGMGALQINGAGPSDPERRRQLEAAGWRRYSLKIGDKYWSYLYTPIGLGLSILGNISDTVRYGELKQADAFTRGVYALSRVGNTIFSQSFLSGLSNVFNALSSISPGETIANLRRHVSTVTGTATTPRIILDIQRLFDPTRYDSNTLAQDFLKNTPFAALTNKPTLNAFGEPVTMPSNRFLSEASKDLAWQIVLARNLRVPVPDKYTTMPDGRGGSRQITPEEYYQYLKTTGPKLKQYILTRQLVMRYGDPTKAQEDLNAHAQQIREPVLRRLRIHARYNPAN